MAGATPATFPPDSGLMTREQAAAYLGIKPQTLAVWATAGRYDLPFIRVGRLVRYRKADLDAFLDRRRVTHTGELPPDELVTGGPTRRRSSGRMA